MAIYVPSCGRFGITPHLARLDVRGPYASCANVFVMLDNAHTAGTALPMAEEVLQTVIDTLKENHVLTHVHLIDDKRSGYGDGTVRTAAATKTGNICCMSRVQQMDYYVGLNRCRYWDLSQAESTATAWIQAMTRVADNVSCLYRLVRDNPLLCD